MSSASVCQQRSLFFTAGRVVCGGRWKSTGDSGHLLPCWYPVASKVSSWASPRGLFALDCALRFSDAHGAVPSLEERAVHAHVEGGTTPHQDHLRSFPQALKKP